MAPISLFVLLQIATTNTTTTASAAAVKPLWVTLVEIAGLLVGIAIVGTLLASLVRTISLKAGASKAVANSVR